MKEDPSSLKSPADTSPATLEQGDLLLHYIRCEVFLVSKNVLFPVIVITVCER